MSMRLQLVSNNHDNLLTHLFSVYYTFYSNSSLHARLSSLFSLASSIISLHLELTDSTEKEAIACFRFYSLWNCINPNHTEIRQFMKSVTRSILSFIRSTSPLTSLQISLLLMKVLSYLHEGASYCTESAFPPNQARVLHILHQLRELMAMVRASLILHESAYGLFLDMWQSTAEINRVGVYTLVEM